MHSQISNSKPRRPYREVEARRLSVTERTQRFIDKHPEYFAYLAQCSELHIKCLECGTLKSAFETLDGFCGFECMMNHKFNISLKEDS